jgi:hypothetical protein
VFRAERKATSLRPASPDPVNTGGGIINYTNHPPPKDGFILCHVQLFL